MTTGTRIDAPPGTGVLPRHYLMAAYLIAATAALLPLAFVDLPALVDYPNHIARLHILANVDSDVILASNYRVEWHAMPNLAIDLVSWPFLKFVAPETLGLVFTALTIVLLAAGTIILHRTLHGEAGLWPAAVLLFAYNHLLIMGFLNYLFGLGLALLLFAGWIVSAGRPSWIRLILFPLALLALYFVHLFALGVYGICVAGYELSHAWSDRQRKRKAGLASRIPLAWQFVPVGLLTLATMPTGNGKSFYYGPFLQKVKALWSPTLTYITPTDLAVFLFVVTILVAGLASRRLILTRHMKLPLFLLFATATIMPFKVEGAWGHVWYADLRLPIVIALLLVAGLRPCNISPKTVMAVVSMATVIFAARIYDISQEWRGVDRDSAEFRAALEVIEPGAAILPAQKQYVPVPEGETRFDHAYWHMPVMAVIDRSAFVPTLFTDPTKQPVQAAPARESIDTEFGAPIEVPLLIDSAYGLGKVSGGVGIAPFWENWPQRYDYVVITHFGAKGNPLPEILTPVHEGSFFDIYRTTESAAAQGEYNGNYNK